MTTYSNLEGPDMMQFPELCKGLESVQEPAHVLDIWEHGLHKHFSSLHLLYCSGFWDLPVSLSVTQPWVK